jgi:hypothetical protein
MPMVTPSCISCAEHAAVGEHLPPCFSAGMAAESRNRPQVRFLRPDEVGGACPFLCTLEQFRSTALEYGRVPMDTDKVGRARLPSASQKAHSGIGTTWLGDPANVGPVATALDYRPADSLDSRNLYLRTDVVLRIDPHDPRWATFQREFFQRIAPKTIGVPSRWKLLTSAGVEVTGSPTPFVSVGGAGGTMYVRQDGSKNTVKLKFREDCVGVSLGLKKVGDAVKGFAASYSPVWMPSQEGRIYLGAQSRGDFTKEAFLGKFIALSIGGGAGVHVTMTCIWFGVPSYFPTLQEEAKLFILLFKCRGVAVLKGSQFGLPGFGVTAYRGSIDSAS